jgi:hypothetical protein
MPAVINIHQVAHGDPSPWPDIMAADAHVLQVADPWHMAVIEGASEDGEPAVTLKCEVAPKVYVVMQTTLRSLLEANAALEGMARDFFQWVK